MHCERCNSTDKETASYVLPDKGERELCADCAALTRDVHPGTKKLKTNEEPAAPEAPESPPETSAADQQPVAPEAPAQAAPKRSSRRRR